MSSTNTTKLIKMKKLLLLLTCFIFVFQACEKESFKDKEASVDANYWVNDGVLHFKSSDAYHHLLDSLIQLDYKEFRQWEEANGFSSFWTKQQEILERVDTISNEEDFYIIAAENPKLVYLNDNEMELVEIGSNYRLVGNADGIFCINNMYHRAFPQVLEVTQAGDLNTALLNFKSNKDVASYPIKEETVFLKSVGCGTDFISDTNDNNGNNRSYRKVEAYLIIRINRVNESSCCVTYQQTVDMQIVGKKKNIWGQTYTYETVHYWSDLEVGFERIYKSGTYQCTNIWGCTSPTCDRILKSPYVWNSTPSGQSPEQKVYNLRLYTGAKLYNDPISETTKFDKARLKAWTRGTGTDVYAAICCNYGNCGF